ncbi:TIGR03749 family integrating conjugative element protein [Vibrio sp.]|uniref:TIGR03749 family integrating conjugative element protein n=1 Tax=Vibrio sp. TaxID=678 RepID=UPI003D0FBCFE
MNGLSKLGFLLVMLFTATVGHATEILVWDKKPLSIRLEVGKERIIEFPDNIMIGLPEKVSARMQINSAAGVAYLKPMAPFPKTRITIRLESTNELMFIDMFAVKSDSAADLDMVKILTKEAHAKQQAVKDAQFIQSESVSIKELIQFASHDLYAPTRLKNLTKPVQESSISKPLKLDLMFMGRSASLFDLKALKQYRTLRYTLTAILITNRTYQKQPIRYTDLYPNFIAVSSQHMDVGVLGSESQSTVLYLVTERPLSEDKTYSL